MMGYRSAIQWLVDNDDCYYLDDGPDAPLSVSASLVADIYHKPDEKVRSDIIRYRKRKEANENG